MYNNVIQLAFADSKFSLIMLLLLWSIRAGYQVELHLSI